MGSTGTKILDARSLKPGDVIELDGKRLRVFDLNPSNCWVELGTLDARFSTYYPSFHYVAANGRLIRSEK